MHVRRVLTASILALAMTAGVAASPAAAKPGKKAKTPGVTFEVDAKGRTATTRVVDPAGIDAEVVVGFDARAGSGSSFELGTIRIDAVVDGEELVETLLVEDFTLVGESDFTVALRRASNGETLRVDSSVVQAQALPVLDVLGVLARFGIKHLITWIGRTQLKSAVKSYLLNSVSAAKWAHIMKPKHNWHLLGARSREQVADLMGRAMAEGSHSAYGSAMKSAWRYGGRTITVTYDKASGKVSNGWVN